MKPGQFRDKTGRLHNADGSYAKESKVGSGKSKSKKGGARVSNKYDVDEDDFLLSSGPLSTRRNMGMSSNSPRSENNSSRPNNTSGSFEGNKWFSGLSKNFTPATTGRNILRGLNLDKGRVGKQVDRLLTYGVKMGYGDPVCMIAPTPHMTGSGRRKTILV